MKKLLIVVLLVVCATGVYAKKKTPRQTDREYWCEQAYRMAQPVL